MVQLILLAAKHQPSTNVFGQNHNGFRVEQALVTGFVQVSRQFEVQQRQALIVAWRKLRLDTQQVASIIGHAIVDDQFDTQVRKVMANFALFGPIPIATSSGDECNQ